MSDARGTIEAREATEFTAFPLWNQALVVAALTIVALLAITGIRALALRVTQYQVSVYEQYFADAITRADYDRAIEICTGAIRASVNTSSHWGRAWRLRAMAQFHAEEHEEALADLHRSHVFFQQKYYFAEDVDRAQLAGLGTEVAKKMLQSRDAAGALSAFGIAAAESGRPVDYLRRLHESLNEEARAMLWPSGEISISIRDFGDPTGDGGFSSVVEEQGRTVMDAGIDTASEPPAAHITLSAPTAAGRSAYAVDTWMPVSEGEYALRLVAKTETGPMPQAYLSFWFDSARESVHVLSSEWTPLENGWHACTIPGTFRDHIKAEADRRGFAPHDGILNRAGFEFAPESASKAWLASVELVLQ